MHFFDALRSIIMHRFFCAVHFFICLERFLLIFWDFGDFVNLCCFYSGSVYSLILSIGLIGVSGHKSGN